MMLHKLRYQNSKNNYEEEEKIMEGEKEYESRLVMVKNNISNVN
jgi:hypothetical protein